MRDLRDTSGLSLQLSDDGGLVFGAEFPPTKAATRTLTEMREVLADPEATGPDVLYYMYRDVCRPADRDRVQAAGLRYDITVVMPAMLGHEHSKTYGHYHPAAPDGEFYPEVYEVLAGRAVYVLQRRGPSGAIDEFLAIPAQAGDKVFMLPGYGHVTINVGEEPLVMANWVAAAFSSEYGDYKDRHGAAYYERVVGNVSEWKANAHYGASAKVRTAHPLCPEALTGLKAGRPMYLDGVRDPAALRYLVAPRSFTGRWTNLVS